MHIDKTNWSGEGTFTQTLVDRIAEIPEVESIRVEDAPASRSEADYNFIANEIFVSFRTESRVERIRRFGFLSGKNIVTIPAMTIAGLEAALASHADVGPPDYSDQSMLQYLKTERIVPPYQTRGYKLVELVRLYESGAPRP